MALPASLMFYRGDYQSMYVFFLFFLQAITPWFKKKVITPEQTLAYQVQFDQVQIMVRRFYHFPMLILN